MSSLALELAQAALLLPLPWPPLVLGLCIHACKGGHPCFAAHVHAQARSLAELVLDPCAYVYYTTIAVGMHLCHCCHVYVMGQTHAR